MGRYEFSSLVEFANAAKTTYTRYGNRYTSSHWNDSMTHEKTYQMAMTGDDSLVPEAEKMLEKLDADVPISGSQWIPSIMGAYPIVPEFLAGTPECMRRLMQVPSDVSPINIWVDLNCSAGYSAHELMIHGTAILALAMKLQQVRPVDVKLICALPKRSTKIVVGLNTRPLSLSEACFGLCRVAFCRNLMFGYATAKDGDFTDRIIDTTKELRTFMQLPDNDLVVKGPHYNDYIMSNPTEWVRKQVEHYTMTGE